MDYEIINVITKAEKTKGYGTQLISVYLASNANIQVEVGKLENEYIQANNIQSKQTRNNVQDGLKKIINRIKEYKDLKNGLAIFSGNGEMFSYEPKTPFKNSSYTCDSKFNLIPMYNLIRPERKYCLLVMDGKEATIALLNSSEVKFIKNMDSLVPSKTNKGGQSAARYERVIESAITDYFHRIADVINKEYLSTKFDYLIVGGSGFSKASFLKRKLLNYQIKAKDELFDVGYTNENGIYELINKAKTVFENDSIYIETQLIERFKRELVKHNAYCKEEAKNHINAARTVILSRDLVSEVELEGLSSNAEICVVSSSNQAGKEFLIGFGGFAVIL